MSAFKDVSHAEVIDYTRLSSWRLATIIRGGEMLATDLTFLGLIAALVYYLANARLTLYGWLLTKDLEDARKNKIWIQITWINRFLIASIVAGFILFGGMTFFPASPDEILSTARFISRAILAAVVVGLMIFHAAII